MTPPDRAARLVVVANPRAGAGRAPALAAAVAGHLHDRGHQVELAVPGDVAGVRATVAAAVAGGVDRVVAVGGDGLVHHVVQELAGTATVLGVVPCGTGNDYALALGLARTGDPAAAAARVLAPPQAVDALRTGSGWVATLATAGFSARVAERAEGLGRLRGPLRYGVATLRELPALAAQPMVLTVDGVAHELDVTFLAFGTTAWFGGAMAVCPHADPTDGRSAVTVIGRCSRRELLWTFPRVYAGRHLSHPKVATFTGVDITLARADGTAEVVWADGEVLGPLPLRATTVPSAVLVAGAAPRPRPRAPGGHRRAP